MQNHRARDRSQAHPLRPALELTSWEDIRATLPVDHPRLAAAYDRLSEAETMLYQRWEQNSGSSEIEGDPVGLLLGHPVMSVNGDDLLWIMGLGEKVAALGGHLEVQAIFPGEQLRLIAEPGSEGQPPLTERAMDLALPVSPPEPDPRSTGEVDVDLTGKERALLVSGLVEWSRAAPLGEPLAVAMGFASREDFEERLVGLACGLRYAEPLAPEDWRRVLAARDRHRDRLPRRRSDLAGPNRPQRHAIPHVAAIRTTQARACDRPPGRRVRPGRHGPRLNRRGSLP